MGIQEGLCEGSKKVKKIQSLQFFLIFFWPKDANDLYRGSFAFCPSNTCPSLLHVCTNLGGKHSQSLRNVGLQSMVVLLSNIQWPPAPLPARRAYRPASGS